VGGRFAEEWLQVGSWETSVKTGGGSGPRRTSVGTGGGWVEETLVKERRQGRLSGLWIWQLSWRSHAVVAVASAAAVVLAA
jgi:hypothetical protein